MQKEKLWKIVSTATYWIAITILMLLAISSIFTVLDLPIAYKMYNVQTGSMKPTIQPGDLIVVKKNEEYKIDDIITFTSGTGNSKAVVTHRIVDEEKKEDKTYFITKGDFNSVEDIDRVDPDNIIGKYIFRIPLIGYPIQFIKTPLGLVLLIIVPSTIIVYSEVDNIKKELENRRKKKEDKK